MQKNIKINENGHLEIAGIEAGALVKEYGTPLYVMDEEYIRSVCRDIISCLKSEYPDSMACYASKAFSAKAIYQVVTSEGLGADVVSAGELYTAVMGKMPANRIIYHGNNKSKTELEYAVKTGVYAIVLDSHNELDLLSGIGDALGVSSINVMVRINPGVEAHTHHYMQTSKTDSKFGFSISDGSAVEFIRKVSVTKNIRFIGIHCHIGSQIFETEPYRLAVDYMTDLISELSHNNITVFDLNMGGGYGVFYTEYDKPKNPSVYIKVIADELKRCIAAKRIRAPKLIVEPGRCIVGEAGTTLYRIGSIKEIKDVKKYISVDGGLFENPRYALYQAKYSCMLAERANEPRTERVTVAGKCCETGDIIIEDCMLPTAESGDILAVFTTGAYNYSMASNYNRNAVPPVVFVRNGKSCYAVKPQTIEDIVSRDTFIEYK